MLLKYILGVSRFYLQKQHLGTVANVLKLSF